MAVSVATGKRSAPSRRSSRPRRRRAIVYLDEKDLAYVVYRIAQARFTVADYGEPMPPFELLPGGVALLESALAAPRWGYHNDVHAKAAALFRSIVKNHPLKDGNKRLGVTALDVFLRINRVDLKVSQANLIESALFLAAFPGNFPLDLLTGWIRAGCTGRPRRIISVVADRWPGARELIMKAERDEDLRRGRRAGSWKASPNVPRLHASTRTSSGRAAAR